MPELKVRDAYLAGILDGEGSLGVYSTGRAIVLYVMVSSTTPDLIDWLHTNYPGGNRHTIIPKNEAWKPAYRIQWQGKKAQELVKLALPYLIIKKRHAELFQEWPWSGRGLQLTIEQQVLKDGLISELKTLNTKGRYKVEAIEETTDRGSDQATFECS